jgi:hypothetical protein
MSACTQWRQAIAAENYGLKGPKLSRLTRRIKAALKASERTDAADCGEGLIDKSLSKDNNFSIKVSAVAIKLSVSTAQKKKPQFPR